MPSLTRVQGRPLKRPQLSPRMLEKRRKAAIDWVLGDDSGGRRLFSPDWSLSCSLFCRCTRVL
jgi:hypothetical protein